MTYARGYLDEAIEIARRMPAETIEELVRLLADVRDRGGRVFVLGVGGSAANASHAAADLRNMSGIEAYAATDNVPVLTALINDRGWAHAFALWLEGCRMNADDAVLVFSVGGGSVQPPVSQNLVEALRLARRRGAGIAGVVGRDGGETARLADVCVIVPTVQEQRVTGHTESFQAVIWHLAVSHPRLQRVTALWESMVTPVAAGTA
jgi:D-sedoheptulose 7-phosphate isomerase